MSELQNIHKTYLFIDESGDPSFYASGNRCIVGTEGFKPLLLIGIVKLEDKKAIRNAILQFMNGLRNDPLYNSLPCIGDPKGWYLHASYDNLEVRVKFAEFLRSLGGFEFYCVIGRKRLQSGNAKRELPLKIKYNCEIVLSKETPELSIVDYLLWAIQRYLLQGDKRFYNALEAKYNLVIDLYDATGEKSKYYDSNNKLNIEKMEEFRLDGYK